jgi:hypothetical protein
MEAYWGETQPGKQVGIIAVQFSKNPFALSLSKGEQLNPSMVRQAHASTGSA